MGEKTLKLTQTDLQQSKTLLKNKVREMAQDLTRVEYRERERIAKLLHDELQQIWWQHVYTFNYYQNLPVDIVQ